MPQLQSRKPAEVARKYTRQPAGRTEPSAAAEAMLREMAFVLQATRQVREAILDGRK